MPIIPNFPDDLKDMHHAWHLRPDEVNPHPNFPRRAIPPGQPGSGSEFLIFHRDFMRQFHAWYDGQPGADQNLVAPWSAIPAELRDPAKAGWNANLAAQEARIQNNSPAFANFDDLGIFIEGGIHNWIHPAVADVFQEDVVRTLHSPQSTFFYKIHGLVNHWWLIRFPFSFQLKATVTKVEIDTPPKSFKSESFEIPSKTSITKAEIDVPPKAVFAETKTITKVEVDIPQFKDAFEGPPTTHMHEELSRRLQILEGQVAQGQAFIRPTERPDVGGPVDPGPEHQ